MHKTVNYPIRLRFSPQQVLALRHVQADSNDRGLGAVIVKIIDKFLVEHGYLEADENKSQPTT